MNKIRVKLFNSSVSLNTLQGYEQKWRVFKEFAQYINSPTIPASNDLISYFIVHLACKNFRLSTIKGYLAAISFMHKKQGVSSPCSDTLAKQLLKSISKTKNNVVTQRKPVKEKLLIKIIRTLDTELNHYDALLYKAILCLQFNACMRIGELVVSKEPKHTLKFGKLVLRKKKLSIKLNSYKHHNDVDEKIVVKKMHNSAICPVRAMKKYLQHRPLTSKGECLFVSSQAKPIRRVMVAKVLKMAIASVGLDPRCYNTHSLRSGKATQLHIKRCPAELIKRYGRWKSNAFLKYIKLNKISLPARYM